MALAAALPRVSDAESPAPAGAAAPPDLPAAISAFFQPWNHPDTPGCVVGVERPGAPALLRSFGSADLEHAVPNDADTVFEAGSVSKQFTAAAILVLAGEHRLALDDDIRRYLPEMPDYGTPIRIAQLLGHTSGLRDWGEVEAMAGWPRTTRTYAQRDVLDIAARQRALNFAPGTAYSYTNTGYNLLALIVGRVSGESLAAFTRRRFFEPLGMSHTEWRDDFTRIVAHRAIAYRRMADGYRQEMPFENTYGHGGLLTTVPDLLRWNAALSAGDLGPGVAAELARPTQLNDGRAIGYARGLFVGSFDGVPEIAHSGATASYRAWLGRYPQQQISMALLCNAGEVDSIAAAHSVAETLLPADLVAAARSSAPPLVGRTPQQLAPFAGLYADRDDGTSVRLEIHEDGLRLLPDTLLAAVSANEFIVPADPTRRIRFDGPDALTMSRAAGETHVFRRTSPWAPTRRALQALAGRYASDEALATFIAVFNDGHLEIAPQDRRGESVQWVPIYADTFKGIGGAGGLIYHLTRDARGRVTGFEMRSSRVHALWFRRLATARETARSLPRPAH
jgi:CubicO group peptidase (beta-lactamase class C family)